jgi:hypothetical protein
MSYNTKTKIQTKGEKLKSKLILRFFSLIEEFIANPSKENLYLILKISDVLKVIDSIISGSSNDSSSLDSIPYDSIPDNTRQMIEDLLHQSILNDSVFKG